MTKGALLLIGAAIAVSVGPTETRADDRETAATSSASAAAVAS